MGFTRAEADEDFKTSPFHVALERNESATAFFFDLSKKAGDLGSVKEEFARTFGFEVGAIAVAVGGDVEGVEPSFAVFDFAVGVGEIATTCAEGFNFRSSQDDAGFNRFGDGVVKTGLTVLDFDRFQGA